MAITYIPREKDWIEKFTEGMAPFLQAAFMQKLKDAAGKAEEERAMRKEEREYTTGVAKGELSMSSVPESIRAKLMKGPSVETTGLKGRSENIARLQNLPSTTQVSGIPEFMKRVTSGETPEQAQQRMISGYAQQQQAINPYKALQAQKLALFQPIYDKYKAGIPLTEDEKILISLKAKEKDADPYEQMISMSIAKSLGLDLSDIPQSTPQLQASLLQGVTEEDIQYTMKKHGLSREEVLSRIK